MKDILKGLWKWILAILIILILGLAVLAFRIFVIDKDYDGTADSLKKNKNKKSSSSSATNIVNSNENANEYDNKKSNVTLGSIEKSIVNGAKSVGNATVRGYKEDQENYTYNEYNFDNFFLLYEGKQDSGVVRKVLEHLIDNSNGTFYARTSVESRNFGNNVIIDYNGDLGEYQSSIINLESMVSDGMYEISFEYGFLKSYVNKIVITKI